MRKFSHPPFLKMFRHNLKFTTIWKERKENSTKLCE
jgi:hypothetical protein